MTGINERLAKHNSGLALAAGLSGGGVNRISIKGSRWKLERADGEVINVDTLYLDVILVIGNPNVSKAYYESPYTGADVPPDCFSHNGVGPSLRATKPQALKCDECQHNIWGTAKRNDGSPAKGKRCMDRKLVAAMPIAYLDKTTKLPHTYKLDVPPASLPNLYSYVMEIIKLAHPSGRPMEPFDFFTRITFDPNKDGQVLVFQRLGQLADAHLEVVADYLDSGQADALIEVKDRPIAKLPAPSTQAQIEHRPQASQASQASQATPRDRIAAAKAPAQAKATGFETAGAFTPATPQASGAFEAPEAMPADLDALVAGAGFGVPR